MDGLIRASYVVHGRGDFAIFQIAIGANEQRLAHTVTVNLCRL